jgi:hypothetical protein
MKLLQNHVVPNIKKGEGKWVAIDVEKLSALLQTECAVSEKLAIECIKAIMKTEELIVENGVLTIPKEKETEWLTKLREEEKQEDKFQREAEEILNSDNKWA